MSSLALDPASSRGLTSRRNGLDWLLTYHRGSWPRTGRIHRRIVCHVRKVDITLESLVGQTNSTLPSAQRLITLTMFWSELPPASRTAFMFVRACRCQIALDRAKLDCHEYSWAYVTYGSITDAALDHCVGALVHANVSADVHDSIANDSL